MPPRVGVLTPFGFPSVRGNAVTVERIARGLVSRGVDLRVWDLSVSAETVVEHEATEFAPGLLHAFHGYRAGPLALRLARRLRTPLVVTMTGTDANHDLFDPARAPVVRKVLEGASVITVFHESVSVRIAAALPKVSRRVAVIPQSVFFEEDGESGPATCSPPRRGPLMLFPAGIRMVKNPRFPLEPLDQVVPRHPGFELHYVGPVLDPEEGEALLHALSPRPWARYLGPVPHYRMRSLLDAADIVVNCSISEGGMANSVLEALARARAVLASDIDGNRSLIEEGVTGLVFTGAPDFREKAERLLRDPGLRRRLGEAGRALVSERFTTARELDGYLGVYAGREHVLPNA
jgi:glycosyltransferase involved in cell wall biosynthesis